MSAVAGAFALAFSVCFLDKEQRTNSLESKYSQQLRKTGIFAVNSKKRLQKEEL